LWIIILGVHFEYGLLKLMMDYCTVAGEQWREKFIVKKGKNNGGDGATK
jgi:hypothetical protein